MNRIRITLSAALLASTTSLAQAAGPVMGQTASGAPAKKPPVLVVKDFNQARDLELDQLRLRREVGAVYQKCLEAAKAGPDLVACQSAYQDALTEYMTKQMVAGRFHAAYELGGPARAK